MKSSIINISTLFFALSPLLGIYYIFPGTTIAFFLLLIMLPLNIVFLRTKLDKPLFTWFLSVIIIGWISALINIYTPWFNVSLFFNNHWSIFLCFFPLIFILPHLNVKLYVKLILIIGLFSALFSLYQRLQLFFLGEIIYRSEEHSS